MRIPCHIISVLVGVICAQFPAQLFGAQSPNPQVASLLQLVSCVQTVAGVGSSEYPLLVDWAAKNKAEGILELQAGERPDQGKVMTTTERVESGFFFASNFVPAAGFVDDAARVGVRTSAKTGSNTVRIVDAAPTRGPPSAPVAKTVGSETTEQAAKNADAGYPAGSKKIENINDLPKREGYHYRQLANGDIIVARNPGRASDLPKLKLENGKLVEARGPPAKTADGLTIQQKGVIGEEAAENTMLRAGYTKYEGIDPKLNNSDHGFDGVWVKRDGDGNVSEIVITESKYSTTGKPNFHKTSMGKQMSDSWIDGNIDKLIRSSDEGLKRLGQMMERNRMEIKRKVNIIGPDGMERWIDLDKTSP